MAVMHLDDDEVLRVVLDDLDHHLGVRFVPDEIRITRWPAAFAQYRPHHAAWVDAVEAALPAGVFVTGAGFRGIGIPACVRAASSVAARASTRAQVLAESR
jgi:oxygen-dependent protoporphyrinogen oxidase